jgi:hypothetical protein
VEMERRVDEEAASAVVVAWAGRDAAWALAQPEITQLLTRAQLIPHAPLSAEAPSSAASPSNAEAPTAAPLSIHSSLLATGGEALRKAQSDFLNREGHAANTQESDFARALRLFEAAHALYPRPTVLLSAANMASKLGSCALAVGLYHKVLARTMPEEARGGKEDGGGGALKANHVEIAARRLAEAEEMLASFKELLPGLREEAASAERDSKEKANVADADPAIAAAAATEAAEAAAAASGGAWQPMTEAAVRKLQHEHARGLVLASSQRRAATLLGECEAPLSPTGLAELTRLTLEDPLLKRATLRARSSASTRMRTARRSARAHDS